MKSLIILFLITSCTQKYADYALIRKVEFQNKEGYHHPITLMQIVPTGKDQMKSCFEQWLFFSNAEKEKDKAIPYMVRSLCPGKDYLLNSKMTETWWTTIIFTQSCVEIEASCAEELRRR